jgi:phage-related baseplate assembly protein
MQNDIQKLLSLPDISFIDDITVEELLQDMINDYESEYFNITGKRKTLYPFDKDRIKLQCVALKLYQTMQYIDRTGKMNLLKYATGLFLEHLGALKGIYRMNALNSTCVMRFALTEIRNEVIPIYPDVRVTAGDGIFFAVIDYAEIAIGTLSVDVTVKCLTSGDYGNSYIIGQINTLVDPIPFIDNVINISDAAGGSDIESDDSLRERIYLAPSSYSTAGPEDAYIYWTKYFSNLITDVKVVSNTAGQNDIIVIKKDGEIPDQTFLSSIDNFFITNKIKPNTDLVVASAPTIINYDLEAVYYINTSDVNNVNIIKAKAEKAVSDYLIWQKQVIGRDINPNKLVSMLLAAGVKRVEIVTPSYTPISNTSLAVDITSSVVFGGVEDD